MSFPELSFPSRPASAVCLAALAACTGGSDTAPTIIPGGSGTLGSWFVEDFAPWEATVAQLRQTARYRLQNTDWHFNSAPTVTYHSFPLAAGHIDYAHAVGLTGLGQLIAISDAGFRVGHEAIAGRAQVTGTVTADDHGTMVASIAAGDSATMIGVAPRARLILGAFDTQTDLALTANTARQAGAVALNNSWGYKTPATPLGFDQIFSGTDGAAYLTALRDYAAEGVVVFALSNEDSATAAEIMPALPLLDRQLEPGWLAVGNATATFDADHVLSATRLSSGCLEAAAWCLFADGSWTAAVAFIPGSASASTTSYGFGTGSSFAAPQVSGALALLAEAFPDLTPHQLRLRLLASADNDFAGFSADGSVELVPGFAHAYSDEFGHGFLNLKSALLPIGVPVISVDGAAVPLAEARIVTGAGLGDALTRGLAPYDLAVADSLAGTFAMPAPALTLAMAPEPLSLRAARLGAEGVGSADPGPVGARFDGFSGTDLALVSADAALALHVLMPAPGSESLGLSITRRIGDDIAGLDLGLKLARDGGEVFGLGDNRTGGGTAMAALTLGMRSSLRGDGFLQVGAELGLAQASGGGALTEVGRMAFDSFGAEIGSRNVFSRGDRLTLGLSAPLAVSAGTARARLPVLSTDGRTRMADIALPLAPEAREMDLRIGYDIPLARGADLRLDLIHAANFGNQAGLEDTAGALTLRLSF
ncbi:S8 family serine peptidase [Rhodobacter sp. Har01]|uniref:S8 family peptidase n=1 Tax=Rhodobacter sp. Har01 TaxID=2883999 RepID=UPI001D076870|nr:S8 family peptidase [Rhodobacter sp. Har01]MCB6177141.1 S8 family serine peptidase [Rhodobacter sp. Har01]